MRLLKKKIVFAIFAMLSFTWQVNAQVTIGYDEAPKDFSLLELSTKMTKAGLRMPQLTTVERDALTASSSFKTDTYVSGSKTIFYSEGLTIFNVDNKCIEYWNTKKWISMCLGTANITLNSPCGNATSTTPPTITNADGTTPFCEYTPSETSNPCVVAPGNQPYDVAITAGSSYAEIVLSDHTTSKFSVNFQPNNTTSDRVAVVRVINNCTGEYQEFLFRQKGAACTSATAPTINSTNPAICGSGSVYAWLTNTQEGVNYIWTYGGVVVHIGKNYEIKQSGSYQVYANVVGCGASDQLNVTINGNSSAQTPIVTVTNAGILCGTSSVTLTANNVAAGNKVQWFYNGAPVGVPTTGVTRDVSGASAAGEWFAATLNNGDACYSASSNKVNLIDQTSKPSLPTPQATVNGISFASNPTACMNGSLLLSVSNSASFPTGSTYEWFINGVSLGTSSTNTDKWYVVPSSTSPMVISVQIMEPAGTTCPTSATSSPITITQTAGSITNINGGNKTYVCGTTPATLTAAASGAASYEWYLKGVYYATTATNTLQTSTLGSYTVRYKTGTGNGCWSQFSTAIEVAQSSAPISQWVVKPTVNTSYGQTLTYSVVTAPSDATYTWTAVTNNATNLQVIPIGDGSSASVVYPASGYTSVTITATAANGCGSSVLTQATTMGAGCVSVNGVMFTSPTTSITYDQNSGDKTLNAAANNATSYAWTIDGGSVVSTSTSYAFSTNRAPGNYVVKFTATSSCDGATSSAQITVTIKENISSIPVDPEAEGSIAGITCLDVKMGNFNADCGLEAARINNFENGRAFKYTFSSPKTFSNLRFYTEDGVPLLTTSQPQGDTSNPYTITFRDDIRTFINQNGSKTVKVIAVYTNSKNATVKTELVITVQDCACCGARTITGGWLTFMCHNLGANVELNPFQYDATVYPGKGTGTVGDLYQYGRAADGHQVRNSNPTYTMGSNGVTTHGLFILTDQALGIYDWNNPGGQNLWGNTSVNQIEAPKAPKDPCPTGWKLPTFMQLQSIFNGQSNNLAMAVTQATANTWTFTLNQGFKVGESLYFPVGGWRQGTRGTSSSVKAQYGAAYWTSTADLRSASAMQLGTDPTKVGGDFQYGVTFVPTINLKRTNGYSVRCIKE